VFKTHGATPILILVWFFLATSVNASAVRIALLPDVSIVGDVILLSHLAASPLPMALGASAANVSFGNTPQFGSVRRLWGAAVKAALSEGGLEASAFLIPDVIAVHRAGRPLSAEEVLTAIDDYAWQREDDHRNLLGTFDLAAIENLSMPEGDLALYVKGAGYDSALRRGRLSLASHAYPRINAFQIEWKGMERDLPPGMPRSAISQAVKQPALVQPGTTAQLIVTAADTQMILSVVPLKEGRAGEVIRVRLNHTTKFLNARVVGKNSLEASY
jgi:hypothetical protein